MADREKVIKGLECCCASKANRCESNSCPYWKSEICCIDELLADAIALLKDQNGLMIALEQSNAVNEYLNAEVERLNGLLKEQEAEDEPAFDDWTKGEGR